MNYPDTTLTDEGELQRDAYWNRYAEHWNADKAVQVIEDAIGNAGRPRWIDYRATLGTGEVLHLTSSTAAITTPASSPTTSSGAESATGSGSWAASNHNQP